jgi:hypothetical protein
MTAEYPATAAYLNEELYPCRQKWAWAWVSNVFTAGVRTNGRVESENHVNKALGGPKKTLLQLFNNLNERTDGQTAREMTSAHMVSVHSHHLASEIITQYATFQSSRNQHNSHLGTIFRNQLVLLRQHTGPHALQVCWKQMSESLYYQTEVVQRPNGIHDWVSKLLLLPF